MAETAANLTFDYIVFRLRAVFPGVPFKIDKKVGGRQVSFWVWDFLTEISLCESKVAVVDEVGVARAMFQLKPGQKGSPIFTKSKSIRKPEGLQDFITDIQAHLNGIVAAIDQAQEGDVSEMNHMFRGK